MPDILHSFHSNATDGGDSSLLRPSDWNAPHVVPDGALTIAKTDGLQAALDAKAPASGIAESAVTGLVADLAGKAAAAHSHSVATEQFLVGGRLTYYCAAVNGTALTTGVPTLGHIQAIPLVISRQATLDRLAVNVTTGVAGGKIMLGLYSNTPGDLYPNALLASGEVLTDASGVKEVVINLTLQPGVYWLTYCGNTNTTLAVRAFAVGGLPVILGSDATLPTTPTVGWDVSRAYDSTLPATYPTGSPSRITAAPIAAVYVRLSA
jgi:hypothetical protein